MNLTAVHINNICLVGPRVRIEGAAINVTNNDNINIQLFADLTHRARIRSAAGSGPQLSDNILREKFLIEHFGLWFGFYLVIGISRYNLIFVPIDYIC